MVEAALVERVLGRGDARDDPGAARVLADAALADGNLPLAAAALDRALRLDPDDMRVAESLGLLLDRLAVTEHGLVFRYVPAGTFLMGSITGDVDERPVHPRRVGGFWLTDTPVTWAAYEALMGPLDAERDLPFIVESKIRMYYSTARETEDDWENARRDVKPMVAVGWKDAEALAAKLSSGAVRYGLPTEAEWERAARGHFINLPYPWGDEPPDAARCDSGHFGDFRLAAPRDLPPNTYGLYGMCGGVWEWTADLYDALAYHPKRPAGPADAAHRVLRGGSFADTAEAVTVSFRMTSEDRDRTTGARIDFNQAPNIGFRLARYEVKP